MSATLADALREIAGDVDDGRTERAYQALHDLADRIERAAGEPQGGDVNVVTPNRDEENE